ncbi:unnamed protein product [Paramecium sonneborni]|uniref:Protein kinase domain-containing protein n=1 Tax=Paramecium sonneborni TaxID=65129 RepID=A0A8S1PHF4_9CILI|nr:unnamed protein product [Paramecium sonneborni]
MIMKHQKSPIQIGNFIILSDKLIGKGRHSVIYDCINELNKQIPVCAKIFYNTKVPRSLQIEKLKSINNPNLVKYYEIFEHNNHLIIIMEKCDSNFKTQIQKKPLTEQDTYEFLRQFLKGYQTLIDDDLDLRELKPINILVKNKIYKLTNYGISQLYELIDGEAKAYSAPEVFYEKKQTRIKDVFSLGLVLYFGFCNKLPYTYRTAGDQLYFFRQIQQNGFEMKLEIPLKIQQLIQLMIIYDTSNRITFEDIKLKLEIENSII